MGQAAIPLSMLGAGGLGGLGSIFAPEGQTLSSFEGREDGVGPTGTADEIWGHLQNYLNLALTEAQQPVSARTTVHPLPAFSGGGLPFDISASAVDPNRRDASLRTLEPSGYQTLIPELFGGSRTDPQPSGDDDADPPVFTPRQSTRRTLTSGRGGPGDDIGSGGSPEAASRPYDLEQFGGGDLSDVDQAEGAIALLLKQLGQG